ncbi:hypothetical protein [Salipaludibacillus daqingensis]|uniref:hypothetical protein n=1 Tax=Salipaludibacillus daqingensis TaxID=3041001 RepID=UPI0024739A1E|nr:hypothetical protein [Salipaludibacillus daqingensis]
MRTLIISVIEGMKKSEQIKPLLTKHKLQLSIVSEDRTWHILFDGSNPRFISDVEDSSDVVIEGDNDALKELFLGTDFLLAMNRREEIHCTGSLKYLLWLESLFYLTDIKRNIAAIDFIDKHNS